ncbi:unnamed protein product [Ascophyllum nodosum]
MTSFMQDKRDPEEELCLFELLGEGSYGAVYRGERRTDGAEVAVKIIPVDNPADLLKEVDIMMACSSPYIVRLHDCYYKDNEAWLTMDYVGGGSVSDILDACGATLSEAEARECTAWTVLALDYLHSNRKLHRDVKAGNILLTLDGRAKLADFGVSKEVNTMANKAQTAIGTPYWMAPEVIQEVPYDGQADIWSLAITCIEMVEGNPPLHNVHPMRAIFMIPSKPSPTLSEPAKWSLEFNDFIAGCLKKKPEDRPSSRAILGHPWIASSVKAIQEHGGEEGSSVIRDLVAEHLPALEAFRQDVTEANANVDASENGAGHKTATLRRMSSTRGDTQRAGAIVFSDNRSTQGYADGRGERSGHGHEAGDGDDGSSRGDGYDGYDSYGSDASVVRVPISGGGQADEEDEGDEYSSDGSVIRVPVDGEQEEDGYSSDASVVRVPVTASKETSNGDASKHGGQDELTAACDAVAAEVNREEGTGHSRGDENLAEQGGVALEPAKAMKMNLQAAAKYFAADGGQAARDSAAAGVTGKGHNSAPEFLRTARDHPQAKSLLEELDRLDISFADDLSRLRQNYEARKTDLQAAIRACLESDSDSSAPRTTAG